MNPLLEYFGRISSFGPSAWALGLILAADMLFTAIHIWQEWKGEKWPLYRIFGAIVGFWFPRPIGFALFTVTLAIALWVVGIIAYTGWLPFLGVVCLPVSVGALGAVLGARIGDSIVSHWAIWLAGYRPNPGLSSTVLYALEAIVLLVGFKRGLALDQTAAWEGIVIGFGFFLVVLPLMALLRRFIKLSQRVRWVRNQQIPKWAST